jgi:hypothetical protein
MKRVLVFIILTIIYLPFSSCKDESNSCQYLKKGDVCVNLINRSGHNIKLLTLTHERGKNEITNLAYDKVANITFNSPGESSYTITVVFDDGKIIKSNGAYIEGGYKMTEIINRDNIKSDIGGLY